MFRIVLIYMVCAIARKILANMKEQQTFYLENNNISPMERTRIERKIYIAKILDRVLNYGCIAYLVMECILQFLITFLV